MIELTVSTTLSATTTLRNTPTRPCASNTWANSPNRLCPRTKRAVNRSGHSSADVPYASAMGPARAASAAQATPVIASFTRRASDRIPATAERSARDSATNREVECEMPKSAGSWTTAPIPSASANTP